MTIYLKPYRILKEFSGTVPPQLDTLFDYFCKEAAALEEDCEQIDSSAVKFFMSQVRFFAALCSDYPSNNLLHMPDAEIYSIIIDYLEDELFTGYGLLYVLRRLTYHSKHIVVDAIIEKEAHNDK